jgi:hypothetical protein
MRVKKEKKLSKSLAPKAIELFSRQEKRAAGGMPRYHSEGRRGGGSSNSTNNSNRHNRARFFFALFALPRQDCLALPRSEA